jgi:hypothetical protein
MKIRRTIFLVSALLAAFASVLPAQTNLLLHGGTHVRNGSQALAYLVAQLESQTSPGTSIDLTKPEFSIYQKPGNPSDPGNYELVGVMRPVVDEPTVSALLERSYQLKPSETPAAQEAALGEKLDTMFGALAASASSQSVPAKLSNVIAAALADPQYLADLSLLGKTFPGVNLCMGMGWAGQIPTTGPTTFEIRLRDTNGDDSAVTGRVTIDGSLATATPLPAPGEPVNSGVEVSTTPLPATAFSDFRSTPGAEAQAQLGFTEFKTQLAYRKLNRAVRLRWSTPVPLRQRSILQNGYNVWRIPASSLNPAWLATAPTLSELQSAEGNFKINRLPIMIPEELSPVEASDPADTETNFYTDEIAEDITLPGGEGEFVYFVTAVDILGRDGLVSTGTVVSICERMPPDPVGELTVLNNYVWSGGPGGSGEQRLHLVWSPVTVEGDGGSIEYEIFRWNRYDGPQRSIGAQPVFTTNATSFADDIYGSPNESNAHQTFWYTVRAVKVTGCGRFSGPHSSPVYGVIRDRKGPAIRDTDLDRPCLEPLVIAKPPTSTTASTDRPGRLVNVILRCTRDVRELSWVEFSTTDGTLIARLSFPPENVADHVLTFVSDTFAVDASYLSSIRCRVGAVNGAISDYAYAQSRQDFSKNTEEAVIPFQANIRSTKVAGREPCPQGGQFYPIEPGSGVFIPGSGSVEADPDAVEFKYYRRVDDGPLTFVYREEKPPGAGPSNTSNFTDTNPPPLNGGRVCYYVQAFDSDGNGGPMTLMEDSCTIYPPLAIPTPVLAKISPNPLSGNSTTLKITWSCPPVGVDRFKLYISKDGFVPPDDLGVDLLQNNSAANGEVLPDQGSKRFGVYLSSRIEGRFSGNATDPLPADLPAEFEIDLPADNGSIYTVAVRAIGPRAYPADGGDSTEGELSNVRDGSWSQTVLAGPNVPWPDRPIPPKIEPASVYLGPSLPPAMKTFDTALAVKAEKLSGSDFDGVAVRIGEYSHASAPQTDNEKQGEKFIRGLRFDPNRQVFRLAQDNTALSQLLPCVLYRHRVKNASDPGIENDLVQVTPMMESIAYGFATGSAPNPAGLDTVVYDPFVALVNNGFYSGKYQIGIYLKDTLPVVSGATYRYLLVRFDPVTKEPRDVLPISNALAVP